MTPRVRAIGAYEVVRALKEGGMGEVLLARRRGPGGIERLVAIKTIRAELASAPSVRAMFLDEAGILARLGHPAVAAVHDFGEEGRTLYLVMEYVAGIAFRELVGRVPAVVAARAIAEACRGVHAAHELRDLAGTLLGVVHRDLSPENLMLGFDGHVKVIDFGIALVKGRQAPVTELGTIKGKPPYMSPEQVKNEPVDRQSDVFSLAIVLHELVTGRPLFDGDSIYAVARAVEHAPIPPPSQLAGPLPAGLDAAILRALERDRARRTPTAAALAEELEAVVMAAGGETLEAWAARELAAPARAHRAWLAEVLAGGAVAPLGRPTGAITAVQGPVAGPPPPRTPSAGARDREADPRVAPEVTAAVAPPARRRAVVAAVVLGLVAGAAVMLSYGRGCGARGVPDARALAVAPPDAPLPRPPADAAVADARAALDAAPASPDARTVERRRADARIREPRPDARPRAQPADAQAKAASGIGYLTCRAKPYAEVHIDGAYVGATPFWRREVPAGRHRVVLASAKDGEILVDRMVDVAVGGAVTVDYP